MGKTKYSVNFVLSVGVQSEALFDRAKRSEELQRPRQNRLDSVLGFGWSSSLRFPRPTKLRFELQLTRQNRLDSVLGFGWSSSLRFAITNYQLPITNYRLPITDYQLPITKR
jgi:hypothetical protein